MTSRRSPRIERLAQALAQDERKAPDVMAAFWAEVAVSGTPLIEPAPDAPGESLITFLHRGDTDAANVTLISSLVGFEFPTSQFSLLPGTELWSFTAQARNDLRTTYHIAVDDSLVPLAEETDMAQRSAGWKIDLLNPRRFTIPADEEIPGDQEYSASVIELAEAPRRPYSDPRPGVPSGKLEQFHFSSTLLGNERRFWVYTPPGYTLTGDTYALVVLFDGPVTLSTIPTPTIVDNLLADRRIPPVVLLVIESLADVRFQELMCHQPFADFLAQEALPWLQARYYVTQDPARAVLAGQSAGGVAAAYAALRYPELFGSVLSQSGAFFWSPEGDMQPGWLMRRFAETPTLPLRFYLDVGLLENFTGPRAQGQSLLASNRQLRETLVAKSYPITYVELNSGHDYLQWRGTLADGLLTLLGHIASPHESERSSHAAIEQ